MANITADFEAGTNTNTIATGDAGSATAWDSVTIGTGATVKYDSGQKAHGSLSAKIVHGGTTTASFLLWSTAFGTQTDHYGRAYFYWPGGSPAGTTLLIYNRLSGSGCWRIQVNTSGKFEICNNSAVVVATSTTSVPAGAAWMRLEYHCVHNNAAGAVTLRIYKTSIDAAIASFDEELSTGAIDTLNSSNEILFGVILNMASFTLQMDDIAAGGTTWFGPAGVTAAPTVLLSPLPVIYMRRNV